MYLVVASSYNCYSATRHLLNVMRITQLGILYQLFFVSSTCHKMLCPGWKIRSEEQFQSSQHIVWIVSCSDSTIETVPRVFFGVITVFPKKGKSSWTERGVSGADDGAHQCLTESIFPLFTLFPTKYKYANFVLTTQTPKPVVKFVTPTSVYNLWHSLKIKIFHRQATHFVFVNFSPSKLPLSRWPWEKRR